MADKRQKLVHLHTGNKRAPSASVLNYGEIAVQHNAEDAALYIKTGENTVEKFISKTGVEKLISGATEDYLAIKADIIEVAGELSATTEELKTVSGHVVTLEAASHSHDNKSVLDGINSDKVSGWDTAASNAHNHENKAVLDGITSEKVTSWDNAANDAHTHANKAELDLIASGDKAKWDAAEAKAHEHSNKALLDTYTQTETDLADAVAKKHTHANQAELDLIASGDKAKWDGAVTALDNKVDKVEGKGLSTNDYTTAEKEKLASIAASADTNVIETVKVNGTALTVADKAVDILVAEGTANGTVKVNGVDVNVHGLGSAAYADTTAFDASGAAETVKTQLIGDMTGDTKTLGGLEDRIDALATGSNVTISTATTTEGYLKTYTFSQNGSEIGKVDIPKDLVVTSGQIVEVDDVKYLRLTIANQDTPVDIAVSDLVDVYTQGNGIEISNSNEISAKVVAGNGLSLGSNGIAMAAASSAGAGAMSAADFDKLAGIASGAQVNTLEGVQVNGTDLTIDSNKKVNVTVAEGATNGTIAVNGNDVAVHGLGSAAYSAATDFDAAGAAAAASAAAVTAVVGTTADTKDSDTVYGAKKYADDKVANAVTGATGDTYVSASVSNKEVTVEATQSTKNSLALADSSLQGIESGKESGAQVNANKELDFSEFGIDCGEY